MRRGARQRFAVNRQSGWSNKIFERSAPVAFCRPPVLLIQPRNVLAVRPQWWQGHVFAFAKRLVQTEDLFQDYRARPAIQQQMVTAEKQTMQIAGESKERDAQQGWSRQIEPALPIGSDVGCEPSLMIFARQIAPILLIDRECDTAMDHLLRFLKLFPQKRTAQD